jgi:isocitrate dehydrogenase
LAAGAARAGQDCGVEARFKKMAETAMRPTRPKINAALIAAQGKPGDTGGYYLPDPANALAAMQPSAALNAALAAL